MKYQLWTTDGYGTNSIVDSSDDVSKLITRAKVEVNNINTENSLTAEEKKKNWEAMYIELLDTDSDEIVENAVYGGKDNTGQQSITSFSQNKLVKFADCDVKVRAYLGAIETGKTKDKEDLYAETERGQLITDINDPVLQNKAVYFIRKI